MELASGDEGSRGDADNSNPHEVRRRGAFPSRRSSTASVLPKLCHVQSCDRPLVPFAVSVARNGTACLGSCAGDLLQFRAARVSASGPPPTQIYAN